ncbi:MAG: hypothetical protein HZC28_15340 [Spirochaetes bacterium]|nr:hypothetical protein [Spirochaetota bacterium]
MKLSSFPMLLVGILSIFITSCGLFAPGRPDVKVFPPTTVSASQGLYSDRIVIQWDNGRWEFIEKDVD